LSELASGCKMEARRQKEALWALTLLFSSLLLALFFLWLSADTLLLLELCMIPIHSARPQVAAKLSKSRAGQFMID